MPPKIIDKGKGLATVSKSEKSEPQTPNTTKPKTEPWITVTKKNPQKENPIQTPQLILDQIRHLQQTFEKLSKQEQGNSSLEISKIEALSKPFSRQNLASKSISKPLDNSQIILRGSSQITPSEYFEKQFYQNVVTVEKGFYVKNDPFATIEKFFGKNQFYKPFQPEKNALFWETILTETDSVTLKHNFLDESHLMPAYSTFKIHNIISPEDWEEDLNYGLQFPESCSKLPCYNIPFNYWDYVQAWYNTFYIQSPKHKHTWLIFFDTSCDLSKAPFWFQQWWSHFGSTSNIYKPQIQKSFEIFKTSFIPTEDEKKFLAITLFHSKFHLPWVFSWTFEFSNDSIPIVRRKFKIKWWDKYRIPASLYPANISNWIQENNKKRSQIQTPDTTAFLAQKSQMLSMLAAAKSEEEIKAISMRFLPSLSEHNSQTSDAESEIPDPDDDLFGNSG